MEKREEEGGEEKRGKGRRTIKGREGGGRGQEQGWGVYKKRKRERRVERMSYMCAHVQHYNTRVDVIRDCVVRFDEARELASTRGLARGDQTCSSVCCSLYHLLSETIRF